MAKDLDQDGIPDSEDQDIDGDGIINSRDKQPRVPNSTSLPSGPATQSAPGPGDTPKSTGIKLGFDIVTDGVDTSLVPVQVGAYVVSLASTDPTAYKRIRNLTQKATNRKFNDPRTLGSWLEGLATELFVSADPRAKNISLEQYLTSAANVVPAGTAKKPTVSTFLSTREQTDAEIDSEYRKMFGIAAPKDVKQEYFNRLTKAQKESPQVTKRDASGGIIQTGGLGADVKARIVNNMIAKGAGLEREGKTGDFDVAISQLKDAAADYGVALSDDQVRKYAINAFKSGAGVDAEQEKIKNISKGLYAPIAQFIDQGLTVKDLMQPYLNMKSRVLEIPEQQISLNNKEGQEVMSKVIVDGKLSPIFDYEKSLRADPRWRFTKNANEMASGFVNRILRDFGIVG
jgi:hypothetical protein